MKTIASRWCNNCGRRVRADNYGPNHGLHALLVLLTCGLWLPVYMSAIATGNFVCHRCGRRV